MVFTVHEVAPTQSPSHWTVMPHPTPGAGLVVLPLNPWKPFACLITVPTGHVALQLAVKQLFVAKTEAEATASHCTPPVASMERTAWPTPQLPVTRR